MRNHTKYDLPMNFSLVGAKNRWGSDYPVWDDGFGPLWVYRESLGVRGVVRAQTWEDALDCVYDEILKPIPEDEIPDAYDPSGGGNMDEGTLAEGYHYQSNATGTGIVATDLNGEALDLLTPELMEQLEIRVEVTCDENMDEHVLAYAVATSSYGVC